MLSVYPLPHIPQYLQLFLKGIFLSADLLPTPYFKRTKVQNGLSLISTLREFCHTDSHWRHKLGFFFMIDISFMEIVPCAWQFSFVSWGADDCTYPKCAMGTAFVPELRGNFFATENCFYTSEVVLYPVVVVAVMIVTDRLLLTHAFSQLNSCWIQNEIQHWKRVKNADKISNRHDLCALWAYTVFLLSSSFLNCLSRHHWRRL
jgi:hypothetical protein